MPLTPELPYTEHSIAGARVKPAIKVVLPFTILDFRQVLESFRNRLEGIRTMYGSLLRLFCNIATIFVDLFTIIRGFFQTNIKQYIYAISCKT